MINRFWPGNRCRPSRFWQPWVHKSVHKRRRKTGKRKQRECGWKDTLQLRCIGTTNETLKMSPLPMLSLLTEHSCPEKYREIWELQDVMDSTLILMPHAISTLLQMYGLAISLRLFSFFFISAVSMQSSSPSQSCSSHIYCLLEQRDKICI